VLTNATSKLALGLAEGTIVSAISDCIANNPNDYVRVIGIDTHAKRRVVEKIVHRPGSIVRATATNVSSSHNVATSNSTTSPKASNTISSSLSLDVVETISRLVAQGSAIFTEYADERRYKSNAWETGGRVAGRNAADIARTLESIVRDRSKSYVRLIGVDEQARKRTIEKVIHRPTK
jgi:carbon dioxide concentrating mechanism protein CcmM